MEINQRKNRDFQSFDSAGDVVSILKSQFSNRKLYVKYAVDKVEVTINEYFEDDTVMVVTDPDFHLEGDLIIYGLSDKYVEVDFGVVEVRAPGYFHCRVKSARRALRGRRDLRFKLADDEVVATNFKVSRQTIDLSGFKMPTSIKVLLEQFQTNNSKLSDIFKVDVFSSDDKSPILNYIKKTGETLYISDCSNEESYKPMNEEFVDLNKIYGNELNRLIKKYIEKGYKSALIVPIIYIAENESTIPFAFIQMISKTRHFTMEDILELKNYSFKLVDRIRDANTHLIPVHQQIIDISRGGAKLKITDKNLKKYITKSKGFIFDIVFKLQAPITIFGEVKVTYTDDEGHILVGVDFEGNSSRKGEMKRFYSILKPMESAYKERLIKTMKKKK